MKRRDKFEWIDLGIAIFGTFLCLVMSYILILCVIAATREVF